ncbi:MAG: hypothetical protein WC443_01290 [Desulfobaccales bacterium]
MALIDSEKLISRHSLANGLTLELWNRSRPVAGDRWLVILETRIAIPVQADTLPAELQPQAPAVIAALGAEVLFSRRDERNFIAAEAVSIILQVCRSGFWTRPPDISAIPTSLPGSSAKAGRKTRRAGAGRMGLSLQARPPEAYSPPTLFSMNFQALSDC